MGAKMSILQKIFDKAAGVNDRLEASKLRDLYAEQDKGFFCSMLTPSFVKFGAKTAAQIPFAFVAMSTELAAKIARRPLDTSVKI